MKSHRAVLIFDGDCGFCTSASNFIKAKSSVPIEIHPWQFIDVSEYGLTQAQVAAKVYFVAEGVAYSGHEAFASILARQTNWLLKLAGTALMAPPLCWLARPGYWLVAKFRHKLPGGTPACKL
jgi:predicted DCC family thiol-disulfide oxidoreductase YuxK